MLPPARVVPGPLQGVSLEAGVARARDDERALVGAEAKEALAHRARHEGAVGVVYLGVVLRLGSGAAGVYHISGHRGLAGHEERGLVHVAPDPGYPLVGERPEVLAPPFSRLGIREVRAGAHPRPHHVVELLALHRLAVESPLPALGADKIVQVDLHASVYNGNYIKDPFI